MHAQRKNTFQIRQGNGDYLFTIKGHQHEFYKDIKLFLDDLLDYRPFDVPYNLSESSARSHGRNEHRICLSTNNISWLRNRHLWAGLLSISVIQTNRITDKGLMSERRYFISSLYADSVIILKLVRAHWSIENRCHWQLDIDFKSDWSTLRSNTAALNLSIIKDFCLSLLQNSDLIGSIRRRRSQCSFNINLMIKTLIS